MGAAPARDHTAAPPGTPVWLASACLFSELLCSLPAAPALPDREGERGKGRAYDGGGKKRHIEKKEMQKERDKPMCHWGPLKYPEQRKGRAPVRDRKQCYSSGCLTPVLSA